MADDKKLEDDKEEKLEGEAAEGTEEGKAGGKKSKKKLFIIIGLVVFLLIGGGVGAYFGGFIGGHDKSGAGEASGEAAEKAVKEAQAKHYLDLPEFLVNLNTSSRSSSFLKMTIVIDLADEKDEAAIEANMPRILDSFNAYLRELRPSDLYGSAGLYRLREELLARVNKIVAPVQVNDILFKQILIQ